MEVRPLEAAADADSRERDVTKLTRPERIAAVTRVGAVSRITLPPRVEVAVAAAAAAIGGAAVGAGAGRDALLVAVAVAFCAVGVFQPALFLTLVLLVRPILDRYSESRVHLGFGSLNLAGAIALLLIGITAVVVALMQPRVWPRGSLPYAAILVVSLGAAGVAVAITDAVPRGKLVTEFVRLMALGAAYVLAAALARRGALSPRRLFVVVTLAAVVPSLVGIGQWIHGTAISLGLTIERIYGTFSGPNPFGTYLAIMALILLFLPSDWLSRWLRLGVLALVGAALIGSFSRTGWAIFLLGVVLLGWKNHKRIVIAVFITAAMVGMSIPNVRKRILFTDSTPTVTVVGGQSRLASNSYHWRLENWQVLLERYEDRPFTGFGLRSTQYVNPNLYRNTDGSQAGYTAHSTGVKLLVEGGPLMLAAWVLFFGVVMTAAWRMARAPWEYQPLARIVLGLWAIVVIVGLAADDLLDATALMIAVFALAGAVEGAWQRHIATERVD